MFTTLKRALVILATFAGAMLLLLPLQALAKTPAPAQAALPPSTENGIIGLSLNTEPTPVGDTASLTNTVGGEAPEGVVECPPVPPTPPPNKCVDDPSLCTHRIYLPLIQRSPFLLIDGRIKLVQDDDETAPNVKGLTTFSKVGPITLTLDFSELQISETPQCIKWWSSDASEASAEYAPFAQPTLNNVPIANPGAQQLMIEFVNKQGLETAPQIFTFFNIPNGNFNNVEFGTPWKSYGHSATVNADKKRLMLKIIEPEQCTNATIGFAAASIDLELPSTGTYHLFVDGTVYTQDQNPSNNATFDAFEILLNGHVVQRYSNQDQPIRCNPVINRQVVVDARIPLRGYSGITTLGLENHQRFDNQFATYTEIDMVWIDY